MLEIKERNYGERKCHLRGIGNKNMRKKMSTICRNSHVVGYSVLNTHYSLSRNNDYALVSREKQKIIQEYTIRFVYFANLPQWFFGNFEDLQVPQKGMLLLTSHKVSHHKTTHLQSKSNELSDKQVNIF